MAYARRVYEVGLGYNILFLYQCVCQSLRVSKLLMGFANRNYITYLSHHIGFLRDNNYEL